MKEASSKAQAKLHEIKEDIPFKVRFGKGVKYIKYPKDKVVEKISYQMAKASMKHDGGLIDVFKSLKTESCIPAKVASLLILGSYWKVKLFHPIYWRYLRTRYTYRDYFNVIEESFKAMRLEDFQKSILFMLQVNTLRVKMNPKELEQYLREVSSEKKQTS